MINTKELKEGEVVFVDLSGTDSTGEESEYICAEDVKCRFVNGFFQNIENNIHINEVYGSSVVSFRKSHNAGGRTE